MTIMLMIRITISILIVIEKLDLEIHGKRKSGELFMNSSPFFSVHLKSVPLTL